jgi:hypothetical protein
MNKMRISKLYIAVGMIIALVFLFEITAHADDFDQTTIMTFSDAIQIPGQVLPAGTYMLKLIDGNSDRNIVQIFNANGTVLYATLQTVAAERAKPADSTVVTLAGPGAGQPDVLVNWFYPGDVTGHEFLYSSQKEKELAQATKRTIVTDQSNNTNSDSAGGGN